VVTKQKNIYKVNHCVYCRFGWNVEEDLDFYLCPICNGEVNCRICFQNLLEKSEGRDWEGMKFGKENHIILCVLYACKHNSSGKKISHVICPPCYNALKKGNEKPKCASCWTEGREYVEVSLDDVRIYPESSS